MSVELVTVPYGLAAAQALRDAVAAGKQGDPLAPVTVVVPTNYVGVAARRMLGSGALGQVTDRGVGIAGVTFLTVYRVAEMLGAPRLAAAGRRPVSTPVLGAAVRGVLAREPGMFARGRRAPRHRAGARRRVPRAVAVRRHRARPARARERRAAEVVRVYRAARRALARRVVRRARPDGRRRHRGRTTAAPSSPISARSCSTCRRTCRCRGAALLRAVADHAPLTVVAGVTGVERADAGIGGVLARLGVDLDARRPVPSNRPHGTDVVSASDPDDEVRAVGPARDRRRCATACRSNAWRCSTARPSRTPASCTSSSPPPASRTTARRSARSPRACSGGRCWACSRSPTATSTVTT